jgi:inhibitor of cysteine peptidase
MVIVVAEIDMSEGTKARASVGDTVVVRLPENATTGYLWSMVELGEGLDLDEEHSEPSSDAAPGAGGEHLFIFRAVAPGQWQVRLRLARAWEANPLEERHLTVQVV